MFDSSNLTIKFSKQWAFCAATDKGMVRQVNEDGWQCWAERGLALVADGMGGHESGDVASAMLCESLDSAPVFSHLSERLNWIEDQVNKAHQKIRNYAKQHHGSKTVGSTLVIWVDAMPLGSVLWAGDSRLYRLREPNGALEQLTRDHSQLNEMVDRGLLTADQAQGKKGGNVITRAVGAKEQLHMETKLFEMKPTDAFLLCSDGLYNALPDEMLRQACMPGKTVEERAETLMNQALDAGARDNVTFILIESLSQYRQGHA